VKNAFALIGVGSILLAAACGLDTEGGFVTPNETNPSSTTGSGGSGGTGNMGGSSTMSSGGASSSSSSSSGAGGSPMPENCLNGLDDDFDGMTDCEDSDCGAFTCVPSYPGASQYLSVVSSANQCPTDAPATTLGTCEGQCNCNANGGTCSQSTLYDANLVCGSPSGPFLSPLNCFDFSNTNVSRAFLATVTHRNDASCTPTNATAAAAQSQACALATPGACTNVGEVCVPTVQAKTASCVLVPGEVTCQSPYTVGSTVYEDSSTTCNCSCGSGTPSCPGASLIRYTSTNCSTGANTHQLSGCTVVNGINSVRIDDLNGSISCTPDGKLVTTTQPQTLCCM
jgi:hypothetical protein